MCTLSINMNNKINGGTLINFLSNYWKMNAIYVLTLGLEISTAE